MYSYMHHKNQSSNIIHVGKYTTVPWILWVVREMSRIINQFDKEMFDKKNTSTSGTSTSGTSNSHTTPIPESPWSTGMVLGFHLPPHPVFHRGSRSLKCNNSGGDEPASWGPAKRSKVWVLTWNMFHQINSANATRRQYQYQPPERVKAPPNGMWWDQDADKQMLYD